jgi:hypothetical protein
VDVIQNVVMEKNEGHSLRGWVAVSRELIEKNRTGQEENGVLLPLV